MSQFEARSYEPEEITAGQAARILGVSRQTVHDRVKAGTLLPKGRSIDGVYIFSRTHIKEEADRGKESAGENP